MALNIHRVVQCLIFNVCSSVALRAYASGMNRSPHQQPPTTVNTYFGKVECKPYGHCFLSSVEGDLASGLL